MINPQRKPTRPEKISMRNLKKFLPKLSSMAKKEGLAENKNDADKPREAIKVQG